MFLKDENYGSRALFVKRVLNPKDPWSGQIGLPGGKREIEDLDLKQTMIRETLEETGINLLDRCHFLGVMNTFRSTLRSEMKVLPFVVLLEVEPTIRLNLGELESYVWIPLTKLTKCEGSVKFGSEKVSAFIAGDIVIWGLTYKILKEFLRILIKKETNKA